MLSSRSNVLEFAVLIFMHSKARSPFLIIQGYWDTSWQVNLLNLTMLLVLRMENQFHLYLITIVATVSPAEMENLIAVCKCRSAAYTLTAAWLNIYLFLHHHYCTAKD